MGKPRRFICSWWTKGKFNRMVRSSTLTNLKQSISFARENRHIYLHIGTIPPDAQDEEVEQFMVDVQKMLKEKFNLKGKAIKYEPSKKT